MDNSRIRGELETVNIKHTKKQEAFFLFQQDGRNCGHAIILCSGMSTKIENSSGSDKFGFCFSVADSLLVPIQLRHQPAHQINKATGINKSVNILFCLRIIISLHSLFIKLHNINIYIT